MFRLDFSLEYYYIQLLPLSEVSQIGLVLMNKN